MASEMDNLVGVEGAAKFWGVSAYTVRRKVKRKEISYVRIGRRILFDPKILQEFVDKNRVAATVGADAA